MVEWIKLYLRTFRESRKIGVIENMKNGDTYLVIWFKLLCMAGEINNGGAIYITDKKPFDIPTLSDQLKKPESMVRMALNIFTEYDMIVIDDLGYIQIVNWGKYQNEDGLEKIRLQTRTRVARCREKKKVTECNATCNATVTQGNATEGEVDIRDKKKKEKIREEERGDDPAIAEIADLFNSICTSLPPVRFLSQQHKNALLTGLKKFAVEHYRLCFEKAEASAFLKGRNDRRWVATFGWVIEPSNMEKVLNGNYDDPPAPQEQEEECSNPFLQMLIDERKKQ